MTARPSTVTLTLSICVSALLFAGALSIIESLGVSFIEMTDRVWQISRLELSAAFQPLIVGLMVLWALLSYRRGLGYMGLLPYVPLLASGVTGNHWLLLGLASWAAVVLSFIYLDKLKLREGMLVTVSVFKASALLHWLVLNPLEYEALSAVGTLDNKIFYMLSPLSPWLTLILCLVAFKKLHDYLRGDEGNPPLKDIRVGSSPVPLMILMLVSSGIVLYTYLPGVNPSGAVPGIDILGYVADLEAVQANPAQLMYVHGGERPFFFLVSYLLQRALGTTVLETLRLLPALLNPLLVFSVYLFSLELSRDRDTAIWSAFLTVFGYLLSVGLYSYFMANILGLSLTYLSLALLFRAVRTGSVSQLLFSSLLSGLTIFTHPWTFMHFTIPVLPVAVLNGLRPGSVKKGNLYLGLYLAGGLIFELVKEVFLAQYGGVAAAGTFITQLTTIPGFLRDLSLGSIIIFGGVQISLVLTTLAAVGVLYINGDTLEHRYMITLAAMSLLVFLVGNAEIKSRVLYNTPLNILAAIGYVGYTRRKGSDPILFGAVTLTMITGLFRALTNII